MRSHILLLFFFHFIDILITWQLGMETWCVNPFVTVVTSSTIEMWCLFCFHVGCFFASRHCLPPCSVCAPVDQFIDLLRNLNSLISKSHVDNNTTTAKSLMVSLLHLRSSKSETSGNSPAIAGQIKWHRLTKSNRKMKKEKKKKPITNTETYRFVFNILPKAETVVNHQQDNITCNAEAQEVDENKLFHRNICESIQMTMS